MERKDSSWHIGDPVIEWGGRAEGGDDQQFEFSDVKNIRNRKQGRQAGTTASEAPEDDQLSSV